MRRLCRGLMRRLCRGFHENNRMSGVDRTDGVDGFFRITRVSEKAQTWAIARRATIGAMVGEDNGVGGLVVLLGCGCGCLSGLSRDSMTVVMGARQGDG